MQAREYGLVDEVVIPKRDKKKVKSENGGEKAKTS
jgi:hypothetical protein